MPAPVQRAVGLFRPPILLIFGQLFQRLLRCGKSGSLLMKFFQQLLLTRFVIFSISESVFTF